MQRILFATITLALLLSGCAPAAPTVSPEQVQASAVAAASTMIALTVAAVPTNTPPPPPPPATDTPLPSPTPLALPTLSSPATTTTGSTGGVDDCNHVFDVGASGPTTTLVVNNNTKGSISGSVYLGTPNKFAQCGWISFGSVAKGQSASIDVPLVHTSMGDSCYWASAWVNDPKKQTQPNGGPFCIDSKLKWILNVGYDKITITPP